MNSDGETPKPEDKQEPMSYKLRYPISIGIVLVIFATIFLGYRSSQVQAPEEMMDEPDETKEESMPQATSAATQEEASESGEMMNKDEATESATPVSVNLTNSSMTIDEIELDEPGYVVAFNDDRFRKDDVIGKSGLLQSGVLQGVLVNFPDVTKAKGTLYAVMFVDDGDGIFNYNQDKFAKDEEGSRVFEEFEIEDTGE
jgi:hypothetical protein